MEQQPKSLPKAALSGAWTYLKALLSWLWVLLKAFFRWLVPIVIANPIPAAVIAGVLLIFVLVWAFWPSGDSINRRKADEARDQGISQTAEIETQKEGVIETKAKAEVAEREVENRAAVTKTARSKVIEAEKRSRRATNERKTAIQSVPKNPKVEEVIANCERVYPGECK